jgi:8-oxo-dGTP pyrophosphatase MutT (NUDIX family)
MNRSEEIIPAPLPTYVVNTEGLVVRDGRYLMLVRGEGESQAPGALAAPGGKVEYGDSLDGILEATLRREILEETGVKAGDMAYVRSSQFNLDTGEPVLGVAFLCKFESGQARVADPGEVSEVLWLTAREIDAHHGTPSWTRATVNAAEALRQALGW